MCVCVSVQERERAHESFKSFNECERERKSAREFEYDCSVLQFVAVYYSEFEYDCNSQRAALHFDSNNDSIVRDFTHMCEIIRVVIHMNHVSFVTSKRERERKREKDRERERERERKGERRLHLVYLCLAHQVSCKVAMHLTFKS